MNAMASIAKTPLSVFVLVDMCETTPPRPHRSRRQWPATAHLLDQLLHRPSLDWMSVDLATLQDLRDETWNYPTVEETWELDEDALPDPDEMDENPWNIVARASELIAYRSLPVVPHPHHPFY